MSSLSKLTFDFTTKTYNGQRAPKNAGVVWVKDSNGKWVHTLEYWAGAPNDDLFAKYVAAQGPDYALCTLIAPLSGKCLMGGKYVGPMPPPDVISGATLTVHGAHTDTWNLKDAKGAVVPDGPYSIVVEIAEDELSERSQEVPFTKGAPLTLMPADTPTVVAMTLTLQ